MCIRDSPFNILEPEFYKDLFEEIDKDFDRVDFFISNAMISVSYTHLRAHETVLDLVCRLLLEKKKHSISYTTMYFIYLLSDLDSYTSI